VKPSVLFIGKKNDFYCEHATQFIKIHFPESVIFMGERNDKFPENLESWAGDYIISYLSPWIIPKKLLNKAKMASINFHPGPPEYPGIGCTNFALYHNVDSFGVTCHHMNPKVDTGSIIAVRRFPLYQRDTVYTLTQRCYGYILQLFYEITSLIITGDKLPQSEERWRREPFKRKELNELCKITTDMPSEEIRRRIRSVTFPNAPGAYVEINGFKFNYETNEE
jgi:methionyl-tRNA formyltransferase